jgi:hypothetical protein
MFVGVLLVYTNKSSSCIENLSLQAPAYANEFNSRLCSQQHRHHQHVSVLSWNMCAVSQFLKAYNRYLSLTFNGVVDVSAADFVP